MEELIKEMKRDIILLSPSYWELTQGNEELIKEDGVIIYYSSTSESNTAGILSNDIETFLKTPINELINRINEIVYYTTESEEEDL